MEATESEEIMDWLRLSVERFFGFLATLIPGSAILLLFVLHKQPALQSLWNAEVLGYETKIAILVLCTFSAGFAVQDGLTRLGGAVGGGIRGFFRIDDRSKRIAEDDVQPWRNPVWRALLRSYLGQSAPNDIKYISDKLLEKRLELIALNPDEQERAKKAVEAVDEKATSDFIDYEWATWWRQLHVPALFQSHNPFAVMAANLSGNFHSASLILLLAMPFTPALRHWWVIVFCLYWIINLTLQAAFFAWSGRDLWSSFDYQLEYLRSLSVKGKDTNSQ